MFYWYVARPNELFADIDSKDPQLKKLRLARARLRGAIEHGKLDVDMFYPYQSESPLHYHFMVKLNQELTDLERILWESRLCDDHYRNNLDFARLIVGGKSWSLLISPYERRSYWRPFDEFCDCPSKHKADVMRNCPVAQKLQCTLNVDHFGDKVEESGPNDRIEHGRGFKW